jgi:hypothetical protein
VAREACIPLSWAVLKPLVWMNISGVMCVRVLPEFVPVVWLIWVGFTGGIFIWVVVRICVFSVLLLGVFIFVIAEPHVFSRLSVGFFIWVVFSVVVVVVIAVVVVVVFFQ